MHEATGLSRMSNRRVGCGLQINFLLNNGLRYACTYACTCVCTPVHMDHRFFDPLAYTRHRTFLNYQEIAEN